MANFRLRNDAEKWFADIYREPPFKVKWDMYYLCLMAGFASRRSSEGGSTTELVERWVEPYRPVSRFLIGLLVAAELKQTSVDFGDKTQVRALFRKLLDPKSPNDLTDLGVRRMNAYASGGYEYLAEVRDQKPYALEEFLQSYPALIASAAAG